MNLKREFRNKIFPEEGKRKASYPERFSRLAAFCDLCKFFQAGSCRKGENMRLSYPCDHFTRRRVSTFPPLPGAFEDFDE